MVTVTDDGGSSGRLRREFDVLPPGDIRNCMVALAEDEALITRLFQYRFSSGNGLKGHSFGNLFLTAMTHLTGDFAHAVTLSSQVLSVLGRIYPATSANVVLEATLADGRKISGETRISRSTSRIGRIRLRPGKPKPLAENASRHRKRRSHYFGPGFVVHQRDPQSAGGRHSASHRQIARPQGLLCKPDVAARGDHQLPGLGSRAGHPAPLRPGTRRYRRVWSTQPHCRANY